MRVHLAIVAGLAVLAVSLSLLIATPAQLCKPHAGSIEDLFAPSLSKDCAKQKP